MCEQVEKIIKKITNLKISHGQMSIQADEQEKAVDICVVPLADYKECRQER